jgi:signal transduction histidine kinase
LSEDIEKLSKEEIIKLSKQLNIALHKQYELLNDLLDWSGIESNQMAFNPEFTFLYEEVMKVFESVSSLAEAKKIQLISEIDGNLEIYADSKILRTLLRNLVSNSIKFTNEGGFVKVGALKKEGHIEVIVKDNGVGMTSDVVNELFSPDSYLTTPGTQNERGTGLGLRFCKQAVDRHNGTIWVESTPGEGSAFHFTIPDKSKAIE